MVLEQLKYIKDYTNVIEFPAYKINNINRSNKSLVTVLGKRYWMEDSKVKVYKSIDAILGATGIITELLILYMYLWYMSY